MEMSALPPKADIAESDWHVRFVPILLQKDFGRRSEEQFSKIKPERGILIQKFGSSDSNIAGFW
jgi:hypothetical protein